MPTPTRVTYRGTRLFANDQQIDRATAFGSTTSLNKEDLFELGNAGLVEIVDDVPEVDITLDSNDYGSLDTLLLLAGKSLTDSYVDFSQDMEYARSDIYLHVSPTNDGEIQRSQYIENAFITSVNLNYSVDGNFTESYSLASDNKTWFLGDAAHIGTVEATLVDKEATALVPGAYKLLAVIVDGRKVDPEHYTSTIDAGSIEVTFDQDYDINAPATVVFRYAGDGGATIRTNNTEDPAALRKGQIEVFLLKDVVHDGGNITSFEEIPLNRLQTVSVDASLDRENLPQLGSTRFYDRPLDFPLNINVSFELTDADLTLFSTFIDGANNDKELRIDDFRNDIGLRIKLYRTRDIDEDRAIDTPLKVIDIPYLIPTDESWDVSTDANASQTFSFRTHELRIKKGS